VSELPKESSVAVKAVLTEALAAALASAHPFGSNAGGKYPEWFRDWIAGAVPKAADAILALSGVAVIQLPEPTWQKTATDEENGANAWEYPDGEIVVYETGDYEWRAFGINHDDPSRLRDAAAALLAAAVLSGEASGE